MDSKQVRQEFFDFFSAKQHKIVSSAPMVVKNDPTLMFTNAGMNQFKDIFLGNSVSESKRIANSQKCLRVSGKHNDLDEVGHDTYHHTMFEMLGNWSFGDYFKKEAIAWAWELLTEVYKINPENLYVTVFGGDQGDHLEPDHEAFEYWKAIIPESRILYGSKKDNFWEMGDTGPCGPCSEVHVDLRDDHEKAKIEGRELVNSDHPQVIEIWNLVFIEFNRKADGKLVTLPSKHVDTGMGFERLCMVLQGKKSNYDTDIFQALIQKIAGIAGFKYGENSKNDIAMRVVADHLRAVVFSIADGQLPSNVKAGYVIRRILRRAIRYGFTFLNMHEPFIYQLVPALVQKMGGVFPEIEAQKELIMKVIQEEEQTFLRTLSQGIKKFEAYVDEHPQNNMIDGAFAFELFDTYGFPVDLTQIMARELNRSVDMDGFNRGLEEQKNRSRKAAEKSMEDWIVLVDTNHNTTFLGYEHTEAQTKIVRYRKITEARREFYQIVLDQTPFYAESGGQVGDTGMLISDTDKIIITDTQKENELIVHIADQIPARPTADFTAKVDTRKRLLTENNHSATHLMHAALRMVLGTHVEQKGSLVDADRLRFDFSHFSKLTKEEVEAIENIVNDKIRENIRIDEKREVPMDDAKQMGAMALFGEKYGDRVRVITFDKNYSVELCGGTHVAATGQIGLFKIVSEGAIAAGIRRIEAVTGAQAQGYMNGYLQTVDDLKELLKNPKDVVKAVQNLLDQNSELKKQIEQLNSQKAGVLKDELKNAAETYGGISFIATRVDLDMAAVKNLAFELNREMDNSFVLLGTENDGKANLTLIIAENLVNEKQLHAGNIIREISKHIQGGGGGQPHFATAGGKNPAGLNGAFERAREIVSAV